MVINTVQRVAACYSTKQGCLDPEGASVLILLAETLACLSICRFLRQIKAWVTQFTLHGKYVEILI